MSNVNKQSKLAFGKASVLKEKPVNADASGSKSETANANKRKANDSESANKGKKAKKSPALDAQASTSSSAQAQPKAAEAREKNKAKRAPAAGEREQMCKDRGLPVLAALDSSESAASAAALKDARFAVQWKPGTRQGTKDVFAKAITAAQPGAICQVEVDTLIRYFQYQDIYGLAFAQTEGNVARLGKSQFQQTKYEMLDGKLVFKSGEQYLTVVAAEDWEQWLEQHHVVDGLHLPYPRVKKLAARFNSMTVEILERLVQVCCSQVGGGSAKRVVHNEKQQKKQSEKILASTSGPLNSTYTQARQAEKEFEWENLLLPAAVARVCALAVEHKDQPNEQLSLLNRKASFYAFMNMLFEPAADDRGLAMQAVHVLYDKFCSQIGLEPITPIMRAQMLQNLWKVTCPKDNAHQPYAQTYWGMKCKDKVAEELFAKLQTHVGDKLRVIHDKQQ